MPDSTSASLLRRVRESPHDPTAWDEFVRRYGPVIRTWCRQWRVQEADADDVMQSVLLKLVTGLRNFEYDPARSFRGWLRTVTYHLWGRLATAASREHEKGGEAAEGLLRSAEAREDLAARLETEYDRELLAVAMLAVSRRVEPHTWEAFRLLALDGETGAEVATRLGMNVAAAYKARSKCQRMIQEELSKLDPEAGPAPDPVRAAP